MESNYTGFQFLRQEYYRKTFGIQLHNSFNAVQLRQEQEKKCNCAKIKFVY